VTIEALRKSVERTRTARAGAPHGGLWTELMSFTAYHQHERQPVPAVHYSGAVQQTPNNLIFSKNVLIFTKKSSLSNNFMANYKMMMHTFTQERLRISNQQIFSRSSKHVHERTINTFV
jgi:hypothetical protein